MKKVQAALNMRAHKRALKAAKRKKLNKKIKHARNTGVLY